MMRYLERQILLQIIDNRWREHLYEMDYLREGIHLRGFAQIDPLVAYKNEGFSMFEALMHSIWEEFARLIFHVEVEVAPPAQEQFAPAEAAARAQLLGRRPPTSPPRWARPPPRPRAVPTPPRARHGAGTATAPATAAARSRAGDGRQGREGQDRPQRPCWCGSGKKYKKCHGA